MTRQTSSGTAAVPDANRIVRFREAEQLTGLSRRTIYRRMEDDKSFPRPIPLSKSTARSAPVGFAYAELLAWVEAQKQARDAA